MTCYSCLDTGKIVGFGLTGRPCPHHLPECEPGACHCGDDGYQSRAEWREEPLDGDGERDRGMDR